LVVFTAEGVPADFRSQVAALGGAVEAWMDGIGAAAVTGLSESAASELAAVAGVHSVEPDPLVSMSEDGGGQPADTVLDEIPCDPLDPHGSFYCRQWNMRAVRAPEAWAEGHLGSEEVVVAILDTGIDYTHPDLAGLVDLQRSKSFVPEEDVELDYPGLEQFGDLFWHGTAAASIVASNAKVLAGVNRHVTLLAVKIANKLDAGSVGQLIAGITYAADQGADVISISRFHAIDKSENPGMVAAFERAANYAFGKGALIVSLPGNYFPDRLPRPIPDILPDLDHNGDIVLFPCEAAHVLCTSATGPTAAPLGAGGLNGPWENVDTWAPYSRFGRSAVDVAAPGGTEFGIAPGNIKIWLPCTSTPTEATTPNGLCGPNFTGVPILQRVTRGFGTSWATPHVAGLAALLVAQLGHGNPALIRARIVQSADDLGEPGDDPYYGKGRINVARALRLVP
jgi:subtilisin family serine protease